MTLRLATRQFNKSNTFTPKQSGFSLIEILFILMFLGMVIVPLGELFSNSYELSLDAAQLEQGFNLAQELLEEITATAFEDPGLAGSFGTEESNRIDYDDVDDYANYGPYNPPRNVVNDPMTNFAAFSRSAQVINIADLSATNMPRANLNQVTNGSSGCKLITVTVTWDNGVQQVQLEKIVSRH